MIIAYLRIANRGFLKFEVLLKRLKNLYLNIENFEINGFK